ncbi:MAG: UDP-N-acetylglucosamine 1-carboxyvinyltransferase [Firmicutes bacterium]|nr:UDP-N-acetylglucosamine 1-carboxyvinyltransferase [Bacillota bacterium]
MSKFVIVGQNSLEGSISVDGSKNSSLPILAATLLAQGCSTIYGIPSLADIQNMCNILKCLGAEVSTAKGGASGLGLTISCKKLNPDVSQCENTGLIRASFLVAGPLLARCKKVKISMPGGCPIGLRPVDLHLKGFHALGAKISTGHGFIEAKCKNLTGAVIYLDFPSVGATENLMMAASLATGQTIIENAAIEPEIVDLANFINAMGGQITGAGTDLIKISGVKELDGQGYTVIPDRIEAGTYAVAAAMTNSKIQINNVIPGHLKPMIAKMRETGIEITEGDSQITVNAADKIKAADIKTLPYPGFPTDMQAPFSSLMTVASGTSIIVETIFENRFLHISELAKMGANIKAEGRTVVIEGVKSLTGAKVRAYDLRGGAALVLAALASEGETEISGIEHIDRGYLKLDEKLSTIGVNIIRV